MPEPGYVPEVVIWTNRQQLALVQHVIDRLAGRVKLIAIGGPREAGLNRFAEPRSLPYYDDPRRLVIEHPAAFTFAACLQDLPPAIVRNALSQGSTFLTLEPIAGDLRELRAYAENKTQFVGIVDLPDLAAMPGWTGAADPLSVLEAVTSLSWLSFFNLGACSLFSRLYEAWRFVVTNCHMPESIDASIAGAALDSTTDLRSLTGTLTAHGRWSDAAGIVMQFSSDHSPTETPPHCERYVHLTGPAARLRVTNDDYALLDASGKVIDRSPPGALPPGFAELVVTAFDGLLRRPIGADARAIHRAAAALACCQATLLSARTGEPESPEQLLLVGGWS